MNKWVFNIMWGAAIFLLFLSGYNLYSSGTFDFMAYDLCSDEYITMKAEETYQEAIASRAPEKVEALERLKATLQDAEMSAEEVEAELRRAFKLIHLKKNKCPIPEAL